MVILEKAQTQNIVLTLTEKTTLTNPYYLFEAFNKERNDYTFCILGADLSEWPLRYNMFEVTETDTPTLAGEISLTKGDYVYRVYEQMSNSNIDTTGLTCVEEGSMQVKQDVTNTEYEGTLTNTVYGG
jgi:hypothetical protein